jgi:hypothetical protein
VLGTRKEVCLSMVNRFSGCAGEDGGSSCNCSSKKWSHIIYGVTGSDAETEEKNSGVFEPENEGEAEVGESKNSHGCNV